HETQRHAVATGMGRGEQLLGIGALLFAETGVERVVLIGEQTALGCRHGTLAALEVTFPNGGGVALETHGLLLLRMAWRRIGRLQDAAGEPDAAPPRCIASLRE